MTYSGWLVWFRLDTPRMMTLLDAPGPPAVEFTFRPATLPTSELATLVSRAWVSEVAFQFGN